MNLLLLQPSDFSGADTVQISDARAQHIRKVLRAELGQQLRCGVLNGQLGSAEITGLGSTIELRVNLNTPAPAKLPLTLLLALPRPKVARRIIRSATELGVEKIILLNSYRVDKSYWQSPLVDDAHLHAAMLEGLEQCGDTQLPSIERATRFKPFVEDVLPALLQHRQGLLAHPYHSQGVPAASNQPRLLAIGPEGGFIPYEVEKLLAAGMQGFSLGPRILKVETAVPSIIGRLFL
ncbi:16S rRNA (uracil(1498)-N(3))-methyltransferase [Spongiibacter sp. UBA1325]|uniref:16S rRNA (uracil(1498)-N(3))-methyltransferase n=1 Tax=Spongiibacter TaxID=630749 RepID=UPI002580E69D|nr:16S rRNA (uracil(1498)-N(3))-methyltransferase [Spongiibacter sp. UBA1325]|tara:strand:+ start:2386 stop:3093 length:708 start_codon:yes stop_codon:yes gene_type:complete